MISYIALSTFVLALAYFLSHGVFLRLPLFKFNRFLFLALLATGLIMPLLPIGSVIPIDQPVVLDLIEVKLTRSEYNAAPMPQSSAAQGIHPLIALWIAGSAFLLGHTLIWLFRFRSELIRSEAQRSQGMKYWVTDHYSQPFSFMSYVMIPRPLLGNPDELHFVLTHERAHIRERHGIDSVVLRLLQIIFWWQPFVWLFSRDIKLLHEFEADRCTSRLTEASNYIKVLLAHVLSVPQHSSLIQSFFQTPIKTRISMLLQSKFRRTQIFHYLLLLPLIAIALFACQDNDLTSNAESDISNLQQIKSEGGVADLSRASDDVFEVVDQMPAFPGCSSISDRAEKKQCQDRRMLEFIYRQINYPKEARQAGIEGTTVVSFIVEKDGSLTNPEVVREIGGGTTEEVLRIVELMNEMPNKWIPGKRDGKPVRVQFNLPIRFKLS